MGIRDVEQMPVYQLFFGLALDVERMTRDIAPEFRWLRLQCLRSSESVCANLAEGFYSQYSTEYVQSLYRCRREARETITHIRYGMGADRISLETGQDLISRYEASLLQLASLIASIERKVRERGKAKEMPCVARDMEERYEAGSMDICEDSAPHQPLAISHL